MPCILVLALPKKTQGCWTVSAAAVSGITINVASGARIQKIRHVSHCGWAKTKKGARVGSQF